MPSEMGKTDMERLGLFSEMEYISIGDKYVSPFNRPFNEAASKNKQMLSAGNKERGATQAGYFDLQFSRIFEGESYSNPVQLRRRYRLAESKKNLGSRPFLPTNGDKFSCGIGTYYGTIGGPCSYFSAQLKDKIPYVPPGKNLYTNPGKKGTGYGYPNLTIGKPYMHSVELYDIGRINFKKTSEEHRQQMKGGPFKLNLYPREYFDMNPYHDDKPLSPPKQLPPKVLVQQPFKPSSPAKKLGGMKAGTFDPFPTYSAEPYGIRLPRSATTNKQGNVFHPNPGTKSRPVRSIMTLNIEKSLNATNYMNPCVMSY
ncbi:cilia-and flagella-associated protein 96 [Candoia aspera]|uniref:cilia-and flagella-associated protein 96 n=1 Tax=Candoia aspera TaxID=51853 RepID=UPI002FD84503